MTNHDLRVSALNEVQVQNSLDPANICQADCCRMYGFYSLSQYADRAYGSAAMVAKIFT